MTAPPGRNRKVAYQRRADLVLHSVWLHDVAHRLYDYEAAGEGPAVLGRVAANLLDFADLIEVADREGWWAS